MTPLLILLFLLLVLQTTALPTPTIAVLPARGGSKQAAPLSPLQTFTTTLKTNRRFLVSSGVARGLSILSMFPLDTIKTRLQMNEAVVFTVPALFNGVGASLVGNIPYAVLTFGGYEMYKQSLIRRVPQWPDLVKYTLAAVAGDVTGSFWLCPSEVIKQNIQGGNYGSAGEAARSIYATSGMGGFYRGYFGNLARDVPFRVFQLTAFEMTKKAALASKEKRNTGTEKAELSNVEAALCGVFAGSFSAALTTPLDKMKTMLMTGQCSGSYVDCVNQVIRDEGVGGLMSGLAPRVGYIAPSVGVFFVVKEAMEQYLDKRERVAAATKKK